MPFIDVKVAGPLTKDQKEKISLQFTATLQEVAGKLPESTYIVFTEVDRENWAKGGKLLSES